MCQLGARLHYATAECFHQHGLLGRLYTDIYCTGYIRALAFILERWPGAKNLAARLNARQSERLPARLIWQFPLFGLRYVAELRRAKSRGEQSAIFLWANRTFERNVLAAGFAKFDTVFAFNTAAADIFRRAKERGLLCILEQTIAPLEKEEEIISEEYWRAGVARRVEKSLGEIVAKERSEWALADLIIVGSPFVAQTLTHLGVPARKVAIVPYGVDSALLARPTTNRSPPDGQRPLRVVFIGNDMVRKGVRYLIEAARELGPRRVSVSVLGQVNDAERSWLGEADNVDFVGFVERKSVGDHLRESDVLVLPSLCEGSAIVTYEALANGIPVICTENTGSVVTNGHDGFLVPLRDARAISACCRFFSISHRCSKQCAPTRLSPQ